MLFEAGVRPWLLVPALVCSVLYVLMGPAYPHRLSYPKVLVIFLLRDSIEARINYTIGEGEEFLRFKTAFGGGPEKMRRALIGAPTTSPRIRLNGRAIGLSVTGTTPADPHESGPYSLDIFLSSETLFFLHGSQGSNTLEVRDHLQSWGLRPPVDATHGHSGVPVVVYAVKEFDVLTASSGDINKKKGIVKDVLLSPTRPLLLTFSAPTPFP